MYTSASQKNIYKAIYVPSRVTGSNRPICWAEPTYPLHTCILHD